MGTGLDHAFIVYSDETLCAIYCMIYNGGYCVIYCVNYILGK